MYLLDTDHCVFFIRGQAQVVEAFDAHSSDEVAVSIITVGELYFGALRSARKEQNLARCREFVRRINVVGLDEDVMLHFATIKADLASRGELIEDPDLLIAACALARGLILITHNTDHFGRIADLEMEDWHA